MTTTNTVGSGKFTYHMDENWAKVPEGWAMPAARFMGTPRTASTVSTGTRTTLS